ncbi:GNAT family N-acetyltransferase [Salinispora fenicalii]|uniref:GNAT family N-acetyltransferase n=1 Tax=Salinispora fenicalii TaxID=1137263 RepID=UPI00165FB01B|nr:GNAT family protein [Salinispora fenicalii]
MNIGPVPLADSIVMRLLEESDAGPLSEAYLLNRAYLQPWEPRRADAFFTLEAQRSRVQDQLRLLDSGQAWPWVLDEGGRVVGTLTLSNVTLGPFRSANIGYWVDHGYAGRGLATQAVQHACRLADDVADLHRLEAGTLVRNVGSQRVLTKAGFTLIGTAANYLHIDGAWQDHLIFQRILNERRPA